VPQIGGQLLQALVRGEFGDGHLAADPRLEPAPFAAGPRERLLLLEREMLPVRGQQLAEAQARRLRRRPGALPLLPDPLAQQRRFTTS
jgi:hypothetical protein